MNPTSRMGGRLAALLLLLTILNSALGAEESTLVLGAGEGSGFEPNSTVNKGMSRDCIKLVNDHLILSMFACLT